MKIIGFEEHYGLPAIYEAAKKANDPYLQVLEALKKAGHFPVSDPKSGFPPGIYDLGEGRIAAMDDVPLGKNGGLKRTIKEYLRENFYGGILADEYVGQEPGAMDKSWSLSYQAYLGMVNTVGIDRVLFTTDYPYGVMKAARQFFDQMPINANDKEKIAYLNAERLLGLGQKERRPTAALVG
jgi:Amidohydrolase